MRIFEIVEAGVIFFAAYLITIGIWRLVRIEVMPEIRTTFERIRLLYHYFRWPIPETQPRFFEKVSKDFHPFLDFRRWECKMCESVKTKTMHSGQCRCPSCWHREGVQTVWAWSKFPCLSCKREGKFITLRKDDHSDCLGCQPEEHEPIPRTPPFYLNGGQGRGTAGPGGVWDFNKKVKHALPWKSPCDTCGGNCGQCASSHCGICGVKPRDGACDAIIHEAHRIHMGGK